MALGYIDAGWYRVVVEVHSDERMVGVRELDFVVVSGKATPPRDQRLGVVLPMATTSEKLQVTRTLVSLLGVPGTVLPIPASAGALGTDGGRNAFRRTGEQMLGNDAELTIALPGLTDALMRTEQLDADRVRELIVLAG